MATLTVVPPIAEQTFSKPGQLQTTLYDLIAAVNDEAEPEEEAEVLATIVHLLQRSRLTCNRDGTTYRLVCDMAECFDRVS
jgi:hypothetical protein